MRERGTGELHLYPRPNVWDYALNGLPQRFAPLRLELLVLGALAVQTLEQVVRLVAG